jgi:protein gp37
MSDKSKIEWTDATWNPVRGCSRVSEGCRNCYAEKVAHRFNGPGLPYEGLTVLGSDGPRWNGRLKFVEEHLEDPLRWKKPRRIFVNSMSDLFHESLSHKDIERIFNVMRDAPQHIFQVLTKRPQVMKDFIIWYMRQHCLGNDFYMLFKHIWFGVSVENQKTADERIPILLETPAAIRWISAEPLLGPISLTPGLVDYLTGIKPEHDSSCMGDCENCPVQAQTERLDWVVVGGESGHNSRPMNEEWASEIMDQCQAAGVPFFMKQMAKKQPIPEHLFVREFPEVMV